LLRSEYQNLRLIIPRPPEDSVGFDSLMSVLACDNPIETLVEPTRQSDKRFERWGHSATLYL